MTALRQAHRAGVERPPQADAPRRRTGAVWLLLVGAATAGAAVLAAAVPAGQPYDEPSHMDTVLQYAHGHALPVLGDPGVTYEAQMGPVYYLMSALPTHLVGDMDHHRPALFVLRFGWLVLIPVLGALTYRLGRELRAGRLASVLAAGLLVLNPSRLAVAASVQNDYLCIVLCCLAAVLVCRSLRPEAALRHSALAGACIGVATLTKVTALVLLVAFIVAALMDSRTRPSVRAARCGVASAVVLVTTGWWFVRNIIEYGDPTAGSAVSRTGAKFPPLAFDGLGSIASWVRSMVSYAFAPTEYYRNEFEAPVAIRALAAVLSLVVAVVVARQIIGTARRGRPTPSPQVVFAVSAVLLTFVGYAVTVWTMQAIAPRLMFVVAPAGAALLAKCFGDSAVRALLTVLPGAFCVLDVWLLIAAAGMPDNPVLWRF